MNKFSYVFGDKIIENDKGKFFITPKCNDKNKIFEYLEQKKFPYFLPVIYDSSRHYEMYPYIEENKLVEDKAIDFVHILSLLHIKTTTYREVVLNDVEKLYQSLSKKIEKKSHDYQVLQNQFEQHVYMSPDEYLFMRNINLFYDSLNMARMYLEEWKSLKENNSQERVVFLHGKPSLSSFIDIDNPYFIHWDLSHKGYVIYDFLFFYQTDFDVVEMESLFQIYQTKYPFMQDEMYLFYCYLLLGKDFDFSHGYYENTLIIQKMIQYLEKTREFVLKQNQKDQETNE